MNRTLLTCVLLASVLAPAAASAQADDGVVERIVVRNRKYQSQGTLELTPGVGFTLANKFTSHTNLSLGIAYNAWETFGFEVRGGYALSSLSSVADQVRTQIYEGTPLGEETTNVGNRVKDDFEDIWRMEWSAMLLPRWMPIYGKLNLATEVPIHFQAYLTAGGGAAGLTRESLVYCQNGNTTQEARPGSCRGFLEEKQTAPVLGAGGGMRFFMSDWAQLRLELLSVSYLDSFREGIDRQKAEGEKPGAAPGTDAPGQGITNLLFLNIGTSFTF